MKSHGDVTVEVADADEIDNLDNTEKNGKASTIQEIPSSSYTQKKHSSPKYMS